MSVIETLFAKAREKGASDIHLSSRRAPIIRLHGTMTYLTTEEDILKDAREILFETLSAEQQEDFKNTQDIDFCYQASDSQRYRGNMFCHYHGDIGAVFRVIPDTIPALESLGLPPASLNFTKLHQGLVLVTGPMGSGKTTTLAALIDRINATRADHILTIEDPVEYIHHNKRGIVNQREVRIHTRSYSSALRAGLREDPDVIMVGELRDLETMSLALTAAETGHLVFGTLHTTDAISTVNRIIDVFPAAEQAKIRTMLAESLQGVISQQLIPRKDGKGMVLAAELLIMTSALSSLVRDNKTFQIPSIIQTGKTKYGMCLLDDSIMELLQAGKISGEQAYAFASDKNLFRQHLTGAQNNGKA
ncbi:MAG: PilT/PilU family type 4a pilus ATPase [Candidatus Auribacterota bacterium]|jgi:twitching motility protein PilT|nr:PilT/PilU family type 4a pilus ATPase [Candidatus Auribacterota bacterium]